MGLDITAYRQLKPAPDAPMEDGQPVEWDKYFAPPQSIINWTETNWPGRTAGLSAGIYSFAESYDFRAGSYGGYGTFRRTLCQLAGNPSIDSLWESEKPNGPFVELLNFADNEGVIGPEVAAKLAQDFATHEDNILAKAPDDYFRGKYRDWRKAFEMAADGGAVDFH